MKLFDVRWANVLRDLPRWTALPLPARRILLDELKPNGYVQVTRFGVQRDVIIASGIPLVDEGHTRLWVGDERRELVKVLRAMDRHPIFDAPATPALVRYMEEHFTNDEIQVLGSHGHAGGGYANRHTLALRVAFAGWVSDFLDADSDTALTNRDTALAAWATARGVRSGDASNVTLRNLQRLSRKLLNFPDGVPLGELVAPLAEDDANDLANALSVGLKTMIVFAGMRHRDLEPMVGLWPGIAHELTRAPVQPPTAVAPVEHFALAIQMEDMTTLLAAIVAAPVRLRADDLAVFARTRVSVESRLVPLPKWSAQLLSSPHFTRVDGAAGELRKYGFVQVRDLHGNPHLEALPAGARWLTLSPHDRLAALIDPLRASTDLNPPGAYQTSRAISFFPFSLSYLEAPKSLRLRDSLTKAFLGAASGFVPLEAFLDHAAREGNPLQPIPASLGRDPYGIMYYGDRGDPREVYRGMWRNMLQQFLVHRLVGLGGANIGRLESGALCFSLTDAGLYLFAVRWLRVWHSRRGGRGHSAELRCGVSRYRTEHRGHARAFRRTCRRGSGAHVPHYAQVGAWRGRSGGDRCGGVGRVASSVQQTGAEECGARDCRMDGFGAPGATAHCPAHRVCRRRSGSSHSDPARCESTTAHCDRLRVVGGHAECSYGDVEEAAGGRRLYRGCDGALG